MAAGVSIDDRSLAERSVTKPVLSAIGIPGSGPHNAIFYLGARRF